MSTPTSKQQAAAAINTLLSNILPGATKIGTGRGRTSKGKGSNAQLINKHVKQAIAIRERDVHGIKKRETRLKKRRIKSKQQENDQLEQAARLEVLRKHKEEGTLTKREQKYLNKVINKNIKGLESWDAHDNEIQELQKSVLDDATLNRRSKSSKTKRRSKKEFNEERKSSKDHKYPGLTPGLAPVGLSDEEESSDEERENTY